MFTIARRSFLLLIAVLAVLTVSAELDAAGAQTSPSGRRVALSGYDPVAYFKLGRPEKGNAAFWFAFDDVIYHFMSAEHREIFAAAGLSKGEKHEPDPEAWAIVNGKLYVVALKERIEQFKKDPDSFINKANANWPRLRDGPGKK